MVREVPEGREGVECVVKLAGSPRYRLLPSTSSETRTIQP